MARLQLNKSSLTNQGKSLATYKQFLPSLDLKRQRLIAERNKATTIVEQTRNQITQLKREAADKLPMLANEEVDLIGLVRLTKVHLGSENLVGTPLPVLSQTELAVRPYSFMALPHWVDNVVAVLKKMLELQALLKVNEQRLSLLDAATKTITQRVNLFDKVLIPRTKTNIKRIKTYLSDELMASVVRSKIAKRKQQER